MMQLNLDFTKFPELETTRLRLREVVDNDVEEVFFLRSDKDVMKFIPRYPAKTKQDALDHIEVLRKVKESQEGINWAITQKGNDTLIGMIGFYRMNKDAFRAEVGYILHPDYQGKGIISEALQKVMEFGFEQMKLHSITAIIDPENIASEKVLQKANFVKEAHFKEDFYFNGEFLDSVHYSIINPQH